MGPDGTNPLRAVTLDGLHESGCVAKNGAVTTAIKRAFLLSVCLSLCLSGVVACVWLPRLGAMRLWVGNTPAASSLGTSNELWSLCLLVSCLRLLFSL